MKVRKPNGNRNEKNIFVPVLLRSKSIRSFAIIPGILILFAQEYFCLYPSNLFLYPIIFILPLVLCSWIFMVAIKDRAIGTARPNSSKFLVPLRYQSRLPVISFP